MEWFGIIFFGLCIYGIIVSINNSAKEWEKLDKMTPSEKAEYLRKQKEAEDKAKYNGLKYTCPMCKSNKIKTISKTSRGTSIALFGGSSDKIGRLYECNDCKYKW